MTTPNTDTTGSGRTRDRAYLNLKAAGIDPFEADAATWKTACDQARAELVAAGFLTYVVRFESGRYYAGYDHETGYAIGSPLCDDVYSFDSVAEAEAHLAGIPWPHPHTVTAVSTDHFS